MLFGVAFLVHRQQKLKRSHTHQHTSRSVSFFMVFLSGVAPYSLVRQHIWLWVVLQFQAHHLVVDVAFVGGGLCSPLVVQSCLLGDDGSFRFRFVWFSWVVRRGRVVLDAKSRAEGKRSVGRGRL